MLFMMLVRELKRRAKKSSERRNNQYANAFPKG
jgi:hypothetical protein